MININKNSYINKIADKKEIAFGTKVNFPQEDFIKNIHTDFLPPFLDFRERLAKDGFDRVILIIEQYDGEFRALSRVFCSPKKLSLDDYVNKKDATQKWLKYIEDYLYRELADMGIENTFAKEKRMETNRSLFDDLKNGKQEVAVPLITDEEQKVVVIEHNNEQELAPVPESENHSSILERILIKFKGFLPTKNKVPRLTYEDNKDNIQHTVDVIIKKPPKIRERKIEEPASIIYFDGFEIQKYNDGRVIVKKTILGSDIGILLDKRFDPSEAINLGEIKKLLSEQVKKEEAELEKLRELLEASLAKKQKKEDAIMNVDRRSILNDIRVNSITVASKKDNKLEERTEGGLCASF